MELVLLVVVSCYTDGESGGASGLSCMCSRIGLEAGMPQKKAFQDSIYPDTNVNVLQDEVQCIVTLRITLLLEDHIIYASSIWCIAFHAIVAMNKVASDQKAHRAYDPKAKHTLFRVSSPYTPKAFIYSLAFTIALCVLFLLRSSIQTSFSPSTSSWAFVSTDNYTEELDRMGEMLKRSVTFLPLKDLRFSDTALIGHTWFMSSLYDTHREGEVQYQEFPSESSQGRILCIKGHDTHDGSWNYYGLAWPGFLPDNATLLKGLTFVSYNHYNYDNIWHGLSSMVPFVAWHVKNGCKVGPARWILYHWGELRFNMGVWLRTLMEATFDGPINIEGFKDYGAVPVCFDKAVVMRHNEGGMSREKRMEVYDLIRCKARTYCNVTKTRMRTKRGSPEIGMTLFMRTGPRSFRNESVVVDIFRKECAKVDGCRLSIAYANNLTVCEQVKLMSSTDILVSPHGAQLTNMFLMDRNSSVMEFFPKGWLKLAGIGQYVYHWIASWSGMRHQGAWRDPVGEGVEKCPYPEDDRRCMSVFKNARIGHNATHFAEWSRNVLRDQVNVRKLEQATSSRWGDCACTAS
ncbi:hypothetical protein AKJ16_DCAP15043 [Drosera capensis]